MISIPIVITLTLLLFVAGMSNAIMDIIDFHFYESVFRKWKWCDPKRSWLNKWKTTVSERAGEMPILNYKGHWYYLGLYTSKYLERFPYSSTVLVFTTDAWHLSKWIMFTALELSLMIGLLHSTDYFQWWIVIIGVAVLKVLRGSFFSLGYDKILK